MTNELTRYDLDRFDHAAARAEAASGTGPRTVPVEARDLRALVELARAGLERREVWGRAAVRE